MSILSFTFFQNGRKVLRDSLAQYCELSLRHVSTAIKNDLLLYYKEGADVNERSQWLGHILEQIQPVFTEGIDGLSYAKVIDRNGMIIAHTDISLINTLVVTEDSLLFSQLQENFVRENAEIIEHIHPLYVRRSETERVFLGVAALGFSKKTVMAPMKHATETTISATLIVLIVSVLLIFFVAHRMTRQIEELGKGVHRISEGDLKKEIPILSNDELGQLASEFNKMIKHLHEKLYMQKFVSKYTIKMIRDRYANGLPSEGESRNVTLLFSDIRNFSNLTERLSPKEIVKLVNIYLDVQSQIIENNHGVVDKFMGDQVMAIFDGENQADNAVKTAVEIQRAIHQLNVRRAELGVLTLKVGIGINVGPAVLGNMGSKNRMDYTVIGDVVNLSARLCSIAKPGQIIAPIEVARRLKGHYTTTQLDPVLVKGRSKPVATFEVDYDHAITM
ncbi:HAMP domain-containing protein [candidate division KSB1 bacterium]|nr:HAMP domain-containing protein [candidate division KSB1 bacterium]